MSPPIYTPDGSEVSEIVLPDGSTASEVIGPDGNVVFEAGPDIPDSVVENWEDGDTTVPRDNWTGWSGDTSNLTNQQTTVINGESSGELTADGSVIGVTATRDTANQPSEVSTLVNVTERNGAGGDSAAELDVLSDGTRLIGIKLRSDGTFNVVGSDKSGSWSLDTDILIRAYNIDFGSNSFDWEFMRLSDSTMLQSGTDSFRNGSSNANQIQLLNDANSGNGRNTAVYDDIFWQGA